jgi:hypothetical protein
MSGSIQSSGKKCLILDLRHINQYVYKPKFNILRLKMPQNLDIYP